LAYIESKIKKKDELAKLPQKNQTLGNDNICQSKCKEKFRTGFDMIKVHLAFGTIGVPSVIDEIDLMLFCRLDMQHDNCLKDCGFSIKFNIRDFICYAHRCRLLLCDLQCTKSAIFQANDAQSSRRAMEFLISYSRKQVEIIFFRKTKESCRENLDLYLQQL
uniref:DB domain-containing protein n=1 Tax=Dracunculus medinensis TaxID=318479 RepID=A0A158Q6M3_DRAME